MQVQIRTRPVPTTFGDLVRGAIAAFLMVGAWVVTDYVKSSIFGTHYAIDYWLVFMAAWSGAFAALRLDRNAGKVISK